MLEGFRYEASCDNCTLGYALLTRSLFMPWPYIPDARVAGKGVEFAKASELNNQNTRHAEVVPRKTLESPILPSLPSDRAEP